MEKDQMKETAQEIPVQEQYTGKCGHCSKINKIKILESINSEPRFCTNCGEVIPYQKSHFL